MCAADNSALHTTPDWAGLPDDALQRVVIAARGPFLGSQLKRDTLWRQLVASSASVCTGFRRALLGPDSSSLWDFVLLSAAHPGLTHPQSLALNRMLARQGHFAASMTFQGGGWELAELEHLAVSLTALCAQVTLHDIDDAAEAAVLGRTVCGQPIQEVYYVGEIACDLPVTCCKVTMSVTLYQDFPVDQALYQPLLDSLRPLSSLLVLSLSMDMQPWLVTRAFAEQLASDHQQLQQLHLHLQVSHMVGRHALRSLRVLQAVQLFISLNVVHEMDVLEDSSLAGALQQLQGMRVEALTITAPECSPAEEALLATCGVGTLTLHFPDPAQRVWHPLPPSMIVLYGSVW